MSPKRPVAVVVAVVAAFAALCIVGCDAHYYLTVPRTRGFDLFGTLKGPCGSFDDIVNPVAFPAKSSIAIAALHSKATIRISVRKQGDTAFTSIGSFQIDFGKEGPCNPPPYLTGHPVDLTTAGLRDGDLATLQTVFDGPDGLLYQCADIKVGDWPDLPPRDDEGVETVTDEDIEPIDPCIIPDIEQFCPQINCGATSTSTATPTSTSTSQATASNTSQTSSTSLTTATLPNPSSSSSVTSQALSTTTITSQPVSSLSSSQPLTSTSLVTTVTTTASTAAETSSSVLTSSASAATSTSGDSNTAKPTSTASTVSSASPLPGYSSTAADPPKAAGNADNNLVISGGSSERIKWGWTVAAGCLVAAMV
ncbi:hypothetical protein HDU96_010816 [Phlyctochytrium bullatum]|nr:hypothetical protein HDU96_010816 [Phlyctochytrium bullatum]